MARAMQALFFIAARAAALQRAAAPPARSAVRLHGAKTDAVVGVIRRVPLLGRLAPKRKPTRLSPPIAPPPDSALDGMPDIVGKLDGVARP